MTERTKVTVLKTVRGASPSRVRIPVPPLHPEPHGAGNRPVRFQPSIPASAGATLRLLFEGKRRRGHTQSIGVGEDGPFDLPRAPWHQRLVDGLCPRSRPGCGDTSAPSASEEWPPDQHRAGPGEGLWSE